MDKALPPVEIDLNPEFQRALELADETDKNVFYHGAAPAPVNQHCCIIFIVIPRKKVVVLAPTGVAVTREYRRSDDSFIFQFKPNVTPAAIKKRTGKFKNPFIKKLTAIVIDEVFHGAGRICWIAWTSSCG